VAGGPPYCRGIGALSAQAAITNESAISYGRTVALLEVDTPAGPASGHHAPVVRGQSVRWRRWTTSNPFTYRNHDNEKGDRRGGERCGEAPGAGEVSPLAPRLCIPHLSSHNDRWGSVISAPEHWLRLPEPGVGPYPADSLPASPRPRSITYSDNRHLPEEGCGVSLATRASAPPTMRRRSPYPHHPRRQGRETLPRGPVWLENSMQRPDLRSSCAVCAWIIVGCCCCRSGITCALSARSSTTGLNIGS
jgi:hypothetical protein